MKNKALFICVDYNSELDSLNLINSILNQSQLKNIYAIISDNSEKNSPNLQNLQKKYKNITYLKNKENLGYFQGANSALNYYLKKNKLPEWVIVSNSDIIIKDTKFFSKLFKIKGKIIVAPSIISAKTKNNQNPFLITKLTAKKVKFYKTLYSSKILTEIYTGFHIIKSKFSRRNKKTKKQIYAPHGSFIIINKEYFKRGGNLDYASFLFGEEIFLAEEAKKAKIKIIYNPILKVIHKENVSTSRIKNKNQFLRKSLLANIELLKKTK